MRLDKLLADMQAGTRSDVKRLIKQGAVTVDGSNKVSPKQQVDPAVQKVCCLGEEVRYQEFVYYMFYKPGDCVTAGLSPVGRLDLDTEGLLLITDDGMLSHNLLSPVKHVEKVYEAKVLGRVTDKEVEAFKMGLDIGDDSLTKPSGLTVLAKGDVSKVRVVLTEGRFHQVKRMFSAVGMQVLFLKRVAMGGLWLDDALVPGEYRQLKEEERKLLGVQITSGSRRGNG